MYVIVSKEYILGTRHALAFNSQVFAAAFPSGTASQASKRRAKTSAPLVAECPLPGQRNWWTQAIHVHIRSQNSGANLERCADCGPNSKFECNQVRAPLTSAAPQLMPDRRLLANNGGGFRGGNSARTIFSRYKPVALAGGLPCGLMVASGDSQEAPAFQRRMSAMNGRQKSNQLFSTTLLKPTFPHWVTVRHLVIAPDAVRQFFCLLLMNR